MGIRTVKVGFLWDCCDGKETSVIEFDNGSLHAVCATCAARFTGPVTALRPTDRFVCPSTADPAVMPVEGATAQAHDCATDPLLEEIGMSDCPFGCKWFRCRGGHRIIVHSATYGCRNPG